MNFQDEINLKLTTIKSPLPDFIYEDLKDFSSEANAYRPQPVQLIEKISQKYHIPKEMIFLTAGNDEAIQIFAKAYGRQTFVFTPTYVVYMDVKELGGNITCIPSMKANEFSIPTNTIPHATLIFLANPNNPSGITSKQKIIELISNNKNAIIVIDEAYGEFANLSIIEEVSKYKNLAVLRSFSKGYGMAGNRIGYVISHPSILDTVKNKTQWANVSYLSVGAALSALNHEQFFTDMRREIIKRRDNLTEFLTKYAFPMVTSNINAILIHFTSETEGIAFSTFLEKHKIIVSCGNGMSNIGLDNSYVRIAIGTDEQTAILKNAIKKYRNI